MIGRLGFGLFAALVGYAVFADAVGLVVLGLRALAGAP